VFQNLLSNSLKYRRSDVGAHVRVRAIPSGTFVKFVFEDNGMGFENKYAETIFMPFKRLQTTAHPGTGLGLSICRRIVEHAGGHMWAESTVGEGSKFYFTLRLV
jgi:signal transduction histidine kinase